MISEYHPDTTYVKLTGYNGPSIEKYLLVIPEFSEKYHNDVNNASIDVINKAIEIIKKWSPLIPARNEEMHFHRYFNSVVYPQLATKFNVEDKQILTQIKN